MPSLPEALRRPCQNSKQQVTQQRQRRAGKKGSRAGARVVEPRGAGASSLSPDGRRSLGRPVGPHASGATRNHSCLSPFFLFSPPKQTSQPVTWGWGCGGQEREGRVRHLRHQQRKTGPKVAGRGDCIRARGHVRARVNGTRVALRAHTFTQAARRLEARVPVTHGDRDSDAGQGDSSPHGPHHHRSPWLLGGTSGVLAQGAGCGPMPGSQTRATTGGLGSRSSCSFPILTTEQNSPVDGGRGVVADSPSRW